MGIYQKITALFAKKQEIEREIITLQKSCKHGKRSIKQLRDRLDSSIPVIRWVCDECSKVIGYPNEKDRLDFLKE